MARNLLLLTSLSFTWVACGESAPPAEEAPAAAPAPEAAAPAAKASTFKGRVLTEDEVVRAIAVLGEVRKAAEARKAQGESAPPQTAASMAELLSKHGFDQKSFSEVQQNVGRAYAVLKFRERSAQIQQMNQEQQARAAQAANGAAPATPAPALPTPQLPAAYGEVPEENVTLLAAHRAEFETATGRPPGPPAGPAPAAAPAPATP